MESIILKHVKKVDFLAITEEQCQRALAILKEKEAVCFVPETGGSATLTPDGLMRVRGIEVVSDFFDVEHEDGYIDISATFTNPLRKKVKKIIFDEETKVICYRAFRDYVNLCEIEIPDTLERIVSPFENCPKLRPYSLPSHLTYISGDAFGIFPDEVALPDGVEEINGLFKESSVKSVTLPPSVKKICMRDFYRCHNLESVTFSEGLEVISDEAFTGCDKLKTLHFPKSLRYIGAYAFSDCLALRDVTIPGEAEMDPNAFFDSPWHKTVQKLRFDAFSPIEYTGEKSSLPDFESIKAALSGQKLSEQAMRFTLSTETVYERYSYGEVDSTNRYTESRPLGESSDAENVIVCEGVVVGAVISGCAVILGKNVCTYSSSDVDGTGGSSRDEYRELIFTRETH